MNENIFVSGGDLVINYSLKIGGVIAPLGSVPFSLRYYNPNDESNFVEASFDGTTYKNITPEGDHYVIGIKNMNFEVGRMFCWERIQVPSPYFADGKRTDSSRYDVGEIVKETTNLDNVNTQVNFLQGVWFNFPNRYVDVLPAVGANGIFYFVPNGSNATNIYIYSDAEFHLVGSTSISLADFYTKAETQQIIDGLDTNLQGQIDTHESQINIHSSQIQDIVTAYIDNKGYFATLTSLQASHPTPEIGDIAYVADALSTTGYYIYNVVDGVWTSSNVEAPPVAVPINDYTLNGGSSKTLKEVTDELALKTDAINTLDQQFSQLEQKLKKTSTYVFTDGNRGANNIIRHLFFDTSGYTGNVSLSGMRIRTLSNGWGDLWGFSLENENGTLIVAPWKATNEQVFEGFTQGIYYYCNFNWNNMEVDHINTIELTSECYKEYNDPRIIKIPDGYIINSKIANDSISTEKVKNKAITEEKVDGRLLESKFINAIGKFEYNITQIVLNAYLGSNGTPNNLNGWGYIRYIPLVPNTTISMNSNTLGYVRKYRALYDKDKQFISGTFGAYSGPIDCDSVIASNPTAKYIGINLIDPSESGSGTIELTPENTADWVILIKSKYVPQIEDLETRVTALENGEDSNKKNVFVYSSSESSIKSPFDNTNDFKLDFNILRAVNNSQNPCFNFVRAKLINKSTSVETQVHGCSDDICPGNYNGTYIGANHGQDATTVTAANHGKSYADIGSKWTDGEKNYYIVAIISANEIQMLSDNQSEYPRWSFAIPNVGTLTHVSGATHTEDIVITARATSQMCPIMSLQSTKIIADNVETTEYGTYRFNNLKISQIYDVRNAASVLFEIVGRVGQFTANPIYSQLGADKVMRHSITYEFNSAQECLITTDFLAYQNVSLGYFGFTQQGVLNGDNVKMYIPKALPISNGQTTLDFRTIAAHNSVPSTMDLTSQYWENELLPPDRWIQFANNISFVGGYLFDKGVGGNERKNVIDNAFFLYTSRKCYPHGIDSKITLSGGQSFSAVNIRKYIPVVSGSIQPFIFTPFEYNNELYFYFDVWSTGIYPVSMPDKYINGKLTIFEKSENVDMLSSTVNSEMLVRVTSATPMYGYLVGKITI